MNTIITPRAHQFRIIELLKKCPSAASPARVTQRNRKFRNIDGRHTSPIFPSAAHRARLYHKVRISDTRSACCCCFAQRSVESASCSGSSDGRGILSPRAGRFIAGLDSNRTSRHYSYNFDGKEKSLAALLRKGASRRRQMA